MSAESAHAARGLPESRAAVSETWSQSVETLRRLLDGLMREEDQEARRVVIDALLTVRRVLGEHSHPVGPQEVSELTLRLRGHIMQIIPLLPDRTVEPIATARRMREQRTPRRFVESIRYLIALAEITRDLLLLLPHPAHSRADAVPSGGARS